MKKKYEDAPGKFNGSMSVDEFIKTFRLSEEQITTLTRLREKGKLW